MLTSTTFHISFIVFRECLEIALLLSIIMAVTSKVRHSGFYIIFGSLLGVLLAAIFAISADYISSTFDGVGDELITSIIILVTVALIIQTIVWMQGYSGRVKANLAKVSNQINAGKTNYYMIIFITSMVILRECSEIILIIYSISAAGNVSFVSYMQGLIIGSLSGFFTGYILYKGLIKFAGKYIFKISSIILAFIAAALAAKAAGILSSSYIIESFADIAWDSSHILPTQSFLGQFFNIMIGYDAKPTWLQIIFYFITLLTIFTMMKIKKYYLLKQQFAKEAK